MSKSDHKDKEIQERVLMGLDANSPNINGTDFTAYQSVFDTLNEKPSGGLPYKFSSSVIGEIQRRQVVKSQFRAKLLVPVFIAIGILLCYLGLHKAEPTYSEEFLQHALNYKWVILFAVFVFFIVEILDFKLVKNNIREGES
jgi:hypothetical protein